MLYALRLDGAFYRDDPADPYPWTRQILRAKLWDNPDVPNAIIARWSKVRVIPATKTEPERIEGTVLGGRLCRDVALVTLGETTPEAAP
jgi:hypothetical protein